MKQYQHDLEPYKGSSTRHECPSCGNKKSFARYIDIETGDYVHDSVGRCNREDRCGYHYSPGQYFIDNGIGIDADWTPSPAKNVEPKPVKFIDPELMKKSLANYDLNNLAKFIVSKFDKQIATTLLDRYLIGTSKHWPGANIFYQVDATGKVRRGKVMLYDPITGRRDKTKITSVHALKKESDIKPPECFFGEHLLNGNDKTVAIVESEKSAIISSLYYPQMVWLASGGLSMLNFEKCQVLKGRTVVLYPDLGGFDRWSEKAALFLPKIVKRYTVSDLLERVATAQERSKGLDLADYLIRFSLDYFTAQTGSNEALANDDTFENLITLFNELIDRSSHAAVITLDNSKYGFRNALQMIKEGILANRYSKYFQQRVREVYRFMEASGYHEFHGKY